MRHRYEPPTGPAAWAFHQDQGTGDPYRDSPAVISSAPPATRIEEFPGEARAAGLRRLSRLTWRATQLSAVTAVGIATLFARTAPAQTTTQAAPAQAAPAHGAKLSASASPSGSQASATGKRRHVARPSAGLKPTVQAGQAASSSPGPSGSSGGGSGSSPSPTLAPPKSTPAPAPPPSSAPAPPPTTSGGSHGGG